MKLMKKVASVLLTLVMAFAILFPTGTAVMAADDTGNSLTVTNKGATSHTFELYQIFTGDLTEDSTTGSKTLTNIQWGSGVTAAGQTAYGTASIKAAALTAAEIKAFADDLIKNSYLTRGVASGEVASGNYYTFANLQAGYYLVVDQAGSQAYKDESKNENSAYTAYIFQVAGSVTQDTKLDVPTIDKKVYDNNDTVTAAVTDPKKVAKEDWHDTADHDVNDSIPYRLIGTLPSNYADYTTYKTYTITDTLSDGLTPPDAGTVKVCLEHKGQETDVTSSFDVSVSKQVLTVALKSGGDLKNVTKDNTDSIIVYYNATLNDNSVIGGSGNPNTVNLQYSNNPNQGGEGEKGKTPDDKNVVFTYKLNVNKYKDNKNNQTTEATFKLYKEMSDQTVQEIAITAGTGTNLTYTASRLDDGKYILQETKAPAGYNKMEGAVKFAGKAYENAVEFEIKPTYEGGENPKVRELDVDVTGGAKVQFSGDATTGAVSTDIIDQKGSPLPSTGGIGTTIFYVVGSILVIGAGVLLVTRKRMNRK
ncbi:MAG: isopeptide-forming domain-containing fimbrial protein [Bilifractor sp.]